MLRFWNTNFHLANRVTHTAVIRFWLHDLDFLSQLCFRYHKVLFLDKTIYLIAIEPLHTRFISIRDNPLYRYRTFTYTFHLYTRQFSSSLQNLCIHVPSPYETIFFTATEPFYAASQSPFLSGTWNGMGTSWRRRGKRSPDGRRRYTCRGCNGTGWW